MKEKKTNLSSKLRSHMVLIKKSVYLTYYNIVWVITYYKAAFTVRLLAAVVTKLCSPFILLCSVQLVNHQLSTINRGYLCPFLSNWDSYWQHWNGDMRLRINRGISTTLFFREDYFFSVFLFTFHIQKKWREDWVRNKLPTALLLFSVLEQLIYLLLQ